MGTSAGFSGEHPLVPFAHSRMFFCPDGSESAWFPFWKIAPVLVKFSRFL